MKIYHPTQTPSRHPSQISLYSHRGVVVPLLQKEIVCAPAAVDSNKTKGSLLNYEQAFTIFSKLAVEKAASRQKA